MKESTKKFLTTYASIRNGTHPKYEGDSIQNVHGLILDLRQICPRTALGIAADLRAFPAEASEHGGRHPDRIAAIAEALSLGLTEAA